MKVKLACLAAVLGVLCFVFPVYAAPAFDGDIELELPNGSIVYAKQHGDETANWITNQANDLLIVQEDENWYYASMPYSGFGFYDESSDVLVSTGVPIDEMPPYDAVTQDEYKEYISQTQPANDLFGFAPQKVSYPSKVRKEENLLVIRVNFSDTKLKTKKKDWEKSIFGKKDSVNAYFKGNSANRFSFKPVPVKTNKTGVIDVTVSKKNPQWVGNPATVNDFTATLELALKEVDKKGFDYAKYDSNKDKRISPDELHILLVYSGYEASYNAPEGPSNWAHCQMANIATLDNCTLTSYTLVGEMHYGRNGYSDAQATIGVICHELSHDLNAYDLYNVLDGSDSVVGEMSLMASGTWARYGYDAPGSAPTQIDPWSKLVMGMFKSKKYSGSSQNVFAAAKKYNIIKVPIKGVTKQYYLVENRQQSNLDVGLNGSGIVVWLVDEAVVNGSEGVNVNRQRRGVDYLPKGDYKKEPFYSKGNTVGANKTVYYKDEKDITKVAKAKSKMKIKVSGSGDTMSIAVK